MYLLLFLTTSKTPTTIEAQNTTIRTRGWLTYYYNCSGVSSVPRAAAIYIYLNPP